MVERVRAGGQGVNGQASAVQRLRFPRMSGRHLEGTCVVSHVEGDGWSTSPEA